MAHTARKIARTQEVSLGSAPTSALCLSSVSAIFSATRASRPNAVCSRECASGQARSDWLAVTARSTCASHRSAERRSAGITQCQKIFRSTLCMALLVAARGGRDVRGGAWACASRAQRRARAARVARGPPPPSLRRRASCLSPIIMCLLAVDPPDLLCERLARPLGACTRAIWAKPAWWLRTRTLS